MKKHLLIYSIAAALLSTACTLGSNTNVVVATNANANAAAEPTVTGPVAAGAGEDQARTAELLVAELYRAHDGKKSPFFQTKNRALVDRYFAKSLADLIWKDATTSSGEVGAIDGDPLYNAQDIEIKNFAIGKGDVKGDAAAVPVTFTNFGTKQNLIFNLTRVSGAWKITDINYGGGESLMKWLWETYPEGGKKSGARSGVFEGKFSVGETSCIVTPTKTTFDVRWAKGSGVEKFQTEDNETFRSVADEGNRFVFNDTSLDGGTFYRSDGKTFNVTRVK